MKPISLFFHCHKIAQKYWDEIPQHFPFIRLDEMAVMPNHIHGILWIDKSVDVETTDDAVGGGTDDAVGCRDAINRVSMGGITGKNNPMFYDNISRVLRWYKGRCTFEINKMVKTRLIASLPDFAWQPRFHDRIIRDENELNRIRNYIIKNPEMWQRDRNNGDL
jgi:REP element-mobilizing transposase RayT